jgi:hypothetical protein
MRIDIKGEEPMLSKIASDPEKIKPGDIVYLKSGSGKLTVASISAKRKLVTVIYSPYGGDGTVMKAHVPLCTLRKAS